jgi:hypothetical protein
MQGVLRTWVCQNRRCGEQFDEWTDYPPCPSCGCARTNWVPAGGHIGKAAPGIDSELKTLADNYGLTDIASARAGERAMPKLPSAPAAAQGDMMQFAPGFVGTPYTLDTQGRPTASACRRPPASTSRSRRRSDRSSRARQPCRDQVPAA